MNQAERCILMTKWLLEGKEMSVKDFNIRLSLMFDEVIPIRQTQRDIYLIRQQISNIDYLNKWKERIYYLYRGEK